MDLALLSFKEMTFGHNLTLKAISWREVCPSPYKETKFSSLYRCGLLSNIL